MWIMGRNLCFGVLYLAKDMTHCDAMALRSSTVKFIPCKNIVNIQKSVPTFTRGTRNKRTSVNTFLGQKCRIGINFFHLDAILAIKRCKCGRVQSKEALTLLMKHQIKVFFLRVCWLLYKIVAMFYSYCRGIIILDAICSAFVFFTPDVIQLGSPCSFMTMVCCCGCGSCGVGCCER